MGGSGQGGMTQAPEQGGAQGHQFGAQTQVFALQLALVQRAAAQLRANPLLHAAQLPQQSTVFK
jgi:hypothetical protein